MGDDGRAGQNSHAAYIRSGTKCCDIGHKAYALCHLLHTSSSFGRAATRGNTLKSRSIFSNVIPEAEQPEKVCLA